MSTDSAKTKVHGAESASTAGLERTAGGVTDEELTAIYNEANGITGKRLPITTARIFTAMRAAIEAERKAAQLRCLKTPVLLPGLHPYTALKVQQMMTDAVGMRSNV